MALWLDYSFGRPAIADMKAKGVVGVLRYLAPDDANNGGKIVRPAERDALLGAGIDIALNYEWYSGRCLEGYAAGVHDVELAVAEAKALGYPAGSVIYFSNDQSLFNQSVIDYFTAVKAGIGPYRVGGYGSYTTVSHLHALGLIDHGWQTLAWSGGQRDPWAVVYQNGEQIFNGSADVDEVTGPVGGWHAATESPLGGGVEITATQEDTLSAAEVQAITDHIDKALTLIMFGDGRDVAAGDNTHPDNLRQIRGSENAANAMLADLEVRVASLQKAVSELSMGGVDASAVVKALASALEKGVS